MRNLNWFQARALAYQGKAIRQETEHKWLTRSLALWWFDRKLDGTLFKHVPLNAEFGPAQFLAKNWTDEPWDTTPAPSPGAPSTPPGGGGGDFGGPSNPPGPGAVNQPGPGSEGSPSTDTGRHCPLGYSLSSDGRKCIKDATPDPTPTVNVYFPLVDWTRFSSFDSSNMCFLEGSGSQTVEVNVTANIVGGPPGVGTLTVSCQGEAQVGTAYPGSSQSFTFPVTFSPGSTITASATYTINGVTYNGNASFHFYDFCGSGDGGAGSGLM